MTERFTPGASATPWPWWGQVALAVWLLMVGASTGAIYFPTIRAAIDVWVSAGR